MKKYILTLLLFSVLQSASGALFPDPWNGANLMLIQCSRGGGVLSIKSEKITFAIEHGANPNLVLPMDGLGPKERSILALTVESHTDYDYHDFILTLARQVTEPTHFIEAIEMARERSEQHMQMSQDYRDRQKITDIAIAQARESTDMHRFQHSRDRYEEKAVEHKQLSEACSSLADNLEVIRKEKFPK